MVAWQSNNEETFEIYTRSLREITNFLIINVLLRPACLWQWINHFKLNSSTYDLTTSAPAANHAGSTALFTRLVPGLKG